MQAQALKPTDAVWWPDAATLDSANLTRFMRALGVDSFEALNQQASADPAGFHDALIRFLDYRFYTPYSQVLDTSEGLPFARWCEGRTGLDLVDAAMRELRATRGATFHIAMRPQKQETPASEACRG